MTVMMMVMMVMAMTMMMMKMKSPALEKESMIMIRIILEGACDDAGFLTGRVHSFVSAGLDRL